MLGVGVEEVEGVGLAGLGVFDVLEEAAKDGQLEGVEEEGEGGFGGEGIAGGVGVVQGEGGEGVAGGVLLPEGDVVAGDGGEGLVEFDAFDAEEGVLRGEKHGAAFAGADVEEDGVFDGLRRGAALQPVVEEVVKDAGGDAVVGGELGDGDAGAEGDDLAGDEAGGVGAVGLVEGVDGGL